MKRSVIAVIKMCGEAVLLTALAAAVIAIIGYWKKWDTSQQYSNALFIAGCLVIIGGAFSRLGAGQDWDSYSSLSAESFRNMSPAQRADFIINASSSVRLVILGALSGILLILSSVLVWNAF